MAKAWATRRRNAALRAEDITSANTDIKFNPPKAGSKVPGQFNWRRRANGAPRKKNLRVADTLSPRAEAEAINAVRDDWKDQRTIMTERQLTEMAKSAEAVANENNEVNEIIKLARKKDGDVLITGKLAVMKAQAKHEGQGTEYARMNKMMREGQQATADRIVCDWIAEVETDMAINRGLQPGSTYILGSHLVCRIIDALNQAGYSSAGRSLPVNKAVG